MFDIGFPELLIVSVVALLVIGPERLPETVRTLALWVGRLKRGLASIKLEIEQEIGADEIRRQLHNESIMKELERTKDDLNEVVNDTRDTVSDLKQAAAFDPTTMAEAPAEELAEPATAEPPKEEDDGNEPGKQSGSG
jgi:sec-independent protein translocase protein TatB